MNQRFYAIAEANHRYSVPITPEKIMQLGKICQLESSTRVLDLACGKGEMLCQWAKHYYIKGTGVDGRTEAIHQAMERSDQMKVWSHVNFQLEDPVMYPQEFHQYDVITCLAGSWVGGGWQNTISLMRTALKSEEQGILIIGESFWKQSPTEAVCDALGIEPDVMLDIPTISDRLDAAGVVLLQLLVTTPEEWDAYYSQQWTAVQHWLAENPFTSDADALRQWNRRNRQLYLKYERQYVGWGVFVLQLA